MIDTEWQPLDTAPKDRTQVWVYDRYFGVVAAFWFQEKDSSMKSDRDGYWLWGDEPLDDPRFWQPMYKPDPPIIDMDE